MTTTNDVFLPAGVRVESVRVVEAGPFAVLEVVCSDDSRVSFYQRDGGDRSGEYPTAFWLLDLCMSVQIEHGDES